MRRRSELIPRSSEPLRRIRPARDGQREPVDFVAEANRYLRHLGYAEAEAHVAATAPGRATLTGELVNETEEAAGFMLDLVRRLPHRADLRQWRGDLDV